MAPYHGLDGVSKQRPSVSSTKALSVRKDSTGHNAVKPVAPALQASPGCEPRIKQAPTIRVIHIFAPKVIKTDMANFRSTVQKLTGRSTKKARAGRRTNVDTVHQPPQVVQPLAPSPATVLWDQERRSQEAVLQRLVGETNKVLFPLVRSSSDVESTSTYSLDSDRDSNEYTSTDHHHAGGAPPSSIDHSFSFYVPAHRESAYSLNEIPAPFFGADPATPPFASPSLGLQLPTPVMESMLGQFDVDNLGSGLGSPLPLSEECDVPFPLLGGSSSGGGNLYDMLSVQQHCRLQSVQQPTFQGGNFFEMI